MFNCPDPIKLLLPDTLVPKSNPHILFRHPPTKTLSLKQPKLQQVYPFIIFLHPPPINDLLSV